ncbi:ArsR/SmtB family transcription factor [Paenibacillus pini]|uniref:Transcriptional regulator n=1 Tax=Paenibacillus pini JCM 16418 TaxID=1236976 RepID=W7YP93_9BACL|nr:ArsR family transcriptional regulator [Paenibacillus pini]GAF09438.1 transcriptional regulator [Paenibacillus pini JCM 16418]
MELDTTENSLPVYEALASQVRLRVIRLLAKQQMNIRELAEALNLSSAIMTMHIKKLERAHLITTRMAPGKGGVQKICSLSADKIEIMMPQTLNHQRSFHYTDIAIGHFTDCDVTPSCGLATISQMIGELDEPRCFWSPERVEAKILWFNQGFLEYKVPNFLLPSQQPDELEISFEARSETPFTQGQWPAGLTFSLNDHELGSWTSPSDCEGKRGKYTPNWWPSTINQYGTLKSLRICREGTFLDGNRISNVTLDMLSIEQKQWTFRISVPEDIRHNGGLTLFGAGFGNYNQDLSFKLYYSTHAYPL